MTHAPHHLPIEILLVEDNPGDVDLVLEVLKESTTPTRVSVAVDGEEAMAFLRSEGFPRPDLVLLDLNLPKKDGREVLSEIKADARLVHTPVIILSSSNAARDLMQAYQLHANCFVTKALDLEEFFAALRSVTSFWLGTVVLPPRLTS
jgi:two-component system, chemotaxis family, response regulator Rcp1